MGFIDIIIQYSPVQYLCVKGKLEAVENGDYIVSFEETRFSYFTLKAVRYGLTADHRLNAIMQGRYGTNWLPIVVKDRYPLTWKIDSIKQVRAALLTWLVIARRLGIPRDVSRSLIAPRLFETRYNDELWVPVVLRREEKKDGKRRKVI